MPTQIIAVANPGFDHASELPPVFGVPMILAGLCFAVAVVLLGAGSRPRLTQALALVGMFGVMVPFLLSMTSATDAHEAAVVEWLDQEYEIEADASAAHSLLYGDSRAVDYDGTVTRIELVETGNGDIAVFSVDTGTALEPAG